MRLARHSLHAACALGVALVVPYALASCAESAPPADVPADAGELPEASSVIATFDAAPASCVTEGWCEVALPPEPVSLNGVWGSAADDVWIVGSPDVTFHWDGVRLATAKAGTRQTPFGVWGSSKNDVWTFSSGQAMWHSEGFGDGGAVWSAYDAGTGADAGGWPGPVLAMGGRANDVWAVGPFSLAIGAPPVWHCDGWRGGAPQWSFVATKNSDPPQPEPLSFTAVWGGDPNQVWIVGLGGKTRVGTRAAGGDVTWAPVNSGTSFDLRAAWGAGDGTVLVAGDGGTMRRFSRGQGGALVSEPVALPTVANLYAIGGSSANDVWVAGSGGALLHWDGTVWSVVDPPIADRADRDLYAIWSAGPNDVWIAGRGTLLHKGSAPLLPGRAL